MYNKVKCPTSPTIASIVGGIQVQEALKLLHDLPVRDGSAVVFNGMTNNLYQTQYPLKEDCLSHETYDDLAQVNFSIESSAQSLFDRLKQKCVFSSGDRLTLLLDRDFVTQMRCHACDILKDN